MGCDCMKTSINMTSVNRIKELAQNGEFWEALDLVEEQDLDKSYNPQFLKTCGEIYLENGRYEESRKALLKAHIMAPEGNRIIYELVRLYLHMGYFTKAEKYYQQYLYNAPSDDVGKIYLEYMIGKARHKDVKELLAILLPVINHEAEDRWIFELALLYVQVGRMDRAIEQCDLISEIFKNTRYAQLALDLKSGELDSKVSFYRYPQIEELENDFCQEEELQLQKDEERIHPKEPIIHTIIEDEDENQDEKNGLFKTRNNIEKKRLSIFKKKDNEEIQAVDEAMHIAAETVSIEARQIADGDITEEALQIAANTVVEEAINIADGANKEYELQEEVIDDLVQENDVIDDIEDVNVTMSNREELEYLADMLRREDMELPSYEDISITDESDLKIKYQDREIGYNGIDEILINELPETAMLLKRLMENQQNIVHELEERTILSEPITDAYLVELEAELEAEIERLKPVEKVDVLEEIEDSNSFSQDISINNEEDLLDKLENKEEIISPEISNDVFEEFYKELQESDEIDSIEIINLWNINQSNNTDSIIFTETDKSVELDIEDEEINVEPQITEVENSSNVSEGTVIEEENNSLVKVAEEENISLVKEVEEADISVAIDNEMEVSHLDDIIKEESHGDSDYHFNNNLLRDLPNINLIIMQKYSIPYDRGLAKERLKIDSNKTKVLKLLRERR